MPATASTSAGGGQAHANMPPFYVLAYIVRVQ
jgi:microcystin-dependent protein